MNSSTTTVSSPSQLPSEYNLTDSPSDTPACSPPSSEHPPHAALLGGANSPIDTKKRLLFSKLAQEDILALEVLRTTHSLNLSAEESKKKLLFVLGSDDE